MCGVDSTPKRKQEKNKESEVEKLNYDKTVSGCKKLLSLIQKLLRETLL